MLDPTSLVLAFLGLALLYAFAMAVMKFVNAIKQRPWVALVVIGMLGAALLTALARPQTQTNYAAFERTSRRDGRAPGPGDHHDL